MRFPSIQSLIAATDKTIKRFPFPVFFVMVGCFYGLRRNRLNYNDFDKHIVIYKLIYCAYLGMLLSLSMALYAERKKFSVSGKWISGIISVLLITVYFFTLPDHFEEFNFRQIALFIIGLHLLIAFVPFISKGEVNGFWQYNKSLFLRILASALYSSVFYIGLALALLAIENLFSVKIQSKWYEDLWVLVFGLFNTLFFFDGIPYGFENLGTKTDYPKGLKIFTQYVLIPLIVVYFVILYAYIFKIIGTGKWPYGWVSYLVLAFAISGIFSLLLIYPVRQETQNKWMPVFSRFFYFALCPLIVMLFIAILRRINTYGITEERYYVFALAFWLAAITIYFIFSKSKNIKVIPISLCILVFGASFGPWGALAISLKSQTGRLLNLMRSNNLIDANQHFIPASKNLHKGDAEQINSIIKYLVDAKGYHYVQPWFEDNLDTMMKGKTREYDYGGHYAETEKLTTYLKIDEFNADKTLYSNNNRNIEVAENSSLINLEGFEYLIPEYRVSYQQDDDSVIQINNYTAGTTPLRIKFDRNTGALTIEMAKTDSLRLNLSAMAKSLVENNSNDTYSQDSLTVSAESTTAKAKFIFKEFGTETKKDSLFIIRLEAHILLHIKRP
jgi:hypothetical protein